MGKKGSSKKKLISGLQNSISLREESSGKKQTNVKAKSMLKLQHIKNLAVWASGETSIPTLAAFFGHRLADTIEALGTTPNPTLFPCQRCETILQPGHNCTVRIEKNRRKVQRRGKKPAVSTQNNVVYRCHFCSHRNLKRGTPSGHMRGLYPQTTKPPSKLELADSATKKPVMSENDMIIDTEVCRMVEVTAPHLLRDNSATNSPSPSTPTQTSITLLEAKRKKRNRSGSKKAAESESKSAAIDVATAVITCNKRKRKSWTSLKEIAESSGKDKSHNFSNMSIPLFL